MTKNKLTAFVVENELVANESVAIGFAQARAAIRGRPVTIDTVEITPDMPRTVFRVVQPEAALIDLDR